MNKRVISILIVITTNIVILKLQAQETFFISSINIEGNIKSQESTILRELPFKLGDAIHYKSIDKLINQARNNLLNLSLFNSVQIEIQYVDNRVLRYGEIAINITLQERWYYWPIIGIILEDKELYDWIRNPDWNYFTIESGFIVKNIAGKNQTLKAILTSGFNKGFYFQYSNINLSSNGKHLLGVTLSRLYSRMLNYETKENLPYYLRSDTSFLRSSYSSMINYIYRSSIYTRHNIEAKFTYEEIDPALLKENPHYWGDEQLKRRLYSLSYNFVLDKRDNIQYPLQGYLIKAKVGGSSTNRFDNREFSASGELHYFGKLSNTLLLSTKIMGGYSWSKKEGYIYNRAFGVNGENFDGYKKYSIDGQQFLLFSPSVKYTILPETNYYLRFISSLPKFNQFHIAIYGRINANIGYAWHNNPQIGNTLSNTLLHSVGASFDIVSYYDITLSFEYYYNHLKEQSFYISLLTPIK